VVGLFLEGHLSYETIAQLYRGATGLPLGAAELFRAAERVYQLEKAFNVKLGLTRKDDYFVVRSLNGDRKENLPFQRINLNHPGMLDEYYRYRGYSREGLPSLTRLREVGLEEVAQELSARNLVSEDSVPSLDSLLPR